MLCSDRSWYNRAGVEKVMGSLRLMEVACSCTPARNSSTCLIEEGNYFCLKYWFSSQRGSPRSSVFRRVPLTLPSVRTDTPNGLKSQRAWGRLFKGEDDNAALHGPAIRTGADGRRDVKRHARLNCISNLAGAIDYSRDSAPGVPDLPPESVAMTKPSAQAPTSLILDRLYLRAFDLSTSSARPCSIWMMETQPLLLRLCGNIPDNLWKRRSTMAELSTTRNNEQRGYKRRDCE